MRINSKFFFSSKSKLKVDKKLTGSIALNPVIDIIYKSFKKYVHLIDKSLSLV